MLFWGMEIIAGPIQVFPGSFESSQEIQTPRPGQINSFLF